MVANDSFRKIGITGIRRGVAALLVLLAMLSAFHRMFVTARYDNGSVFSYAAGCGCLCLAFRLSKRRWSTEALLVFGAVLFATLPFSVGLASGQLALIACVPLLAGVYSYIRGRPVLAGALFGLSLARFALGAPFLLLLALRRDWKPVIVALALYVTVNLAVTPGVQSAAGQPAHSGSPVLQMVAGTGDAGTGHHLEATAASRQLFTLFGPKHRALADRLALTLVAGCTLLLCFVLRPGRYEPPPFDNPLDVSLLVLAAVTLFSQDSGDLAALPIVLYGLADYRFRNAGRMPGAWALSLAALSALILCTVQAGPISAFGAAHPLAPVHDFSSGLLLLLLCSVFRLYWTDRRLRTDRETSIEVLIPAEFDLPFDADRHRSLEALQ